MVHNNDAIKPTCTEWTKKGPFLAHAVAGCRTFNWTYIGDVVDLAGFREQLDALCVVSLHSEM